MADTTPTYALPFQEITDAPDGPSLGEDLALAVEDELTRIDAAIATINGLTVAVASNAIADSAYSSTTFTPGTNVCGVAFTAPPSGSVIVHLKAYFQAGIVDKAAIVSTEIKTGSTVGSGTVVSGGTANANDALVISGPVTSGNECKMNAATPRLITGLTPGSSYNVRVMYQTESTGNITVFNKQVIVVPAL
jgi:hypothetical protein